MGTKARHRVFSIYRDTNKPVVLPPDWEVPGELQTRTFTIHGQDYTLYTQPGVFSWDHLDEGSAFLLDTIAALDLPKGGRILDAGCGYGIIGMVAQRELEPYQVVWVDDDLLAIQCVQATLPDEEHIIAADLTQTSLTGKFDIILCNPPFHREHDKDLGFMRGFAPRASTMLKPNGKLIIVANSFLPYREVLEPRFSQISTAANNDKFQVLVTSV
jgi:16S rRNA (guanine1207-N2)-methyltransferase